jgi:hypothetical protein
MEYARAGSMGGMRPRTAGSHHFPCRLWLRSQATVAPCARGSRCLEWALSMRTYARRDVQQIGASQARQNGPRKWSRGLLRWLVGMNVEPLGQFASVLSPFTAANAAFASNAAVCLQRGRFVSFNPDSRREYLPRSAGEKSLRLLSKFARPALLETNISKIKKLSEATGVW